jgi:DUF1009 family protein
MTYTIQGERIGLIAGWGELPVVVAKTLRDRGAQVFCVGVAGHADPRLKQICHGFIWGGLARTGRHMRFFRRHRVGIATMAGKIFKTLIFQPHALWRNLPDLTFLRFFHESLLLRRQDRRDDTLLMCAVRMYQHYGVEMAAATDLVPEVLVSPGVVGGRHPTPSEMSDIQFGWRLAKEMGRLDVGQTVVVKNQAAIAVEALEGTDLCIRRAGELCRGFTVVKVAKPQQDMRFDVPTIGIGTLRSMVAAGGSVLAIEAGRTIILNPQEVADFAAQNRLSVIALTADGEPTSM